MKQHATNELLFEEAQHMKAQAAEDSAQLHTQQPATRDQTFSRQRGKGSGRIEQRGKNRFLVRVFLRRDENGKRSWLSKSIRGTKKDAQKWLTKTLRDKDLGTLAEPSNETLSQFLNRWLDTIARCRVSERTFEGYKWQLEKARQQIGGLRLSSVKPGDIQNFYGTLSPSTARHVHAPLRSALNQAVKWQLISANPCDAAELPKHQAKEMYAFSKDEAARFLAVEDKYQ